MNDMIEARVYEGEMWVRARDHSQAVGAAFEAGKAVGAAAEREACAKECEDGACTPEELICAQLIRARGQA